VGRAAVAHHHYYARPEFLFALLPVLVAGPLPLRRLMAEGTHKRAFASAGTAVFCLLSLCFALQFTCIRIRRESEAGLRRVVNLIRQRRPAQPDGALH